MKFGNKEVVLVLMVLVLIIGSYYLYVGGRDKIRVCRYLCEGMGIGYFKTEGYCYCNDCVQLGFENETYDICRVYKFEVTDSGMATTTQNDTENI